MFKFILALVVAVLVGGPAGAEFTGGPTGPFVLVDATGKLMGGLANHNGPADGTNENGTLLDAVVISTPEGNAYVGVAKSPNLVNGEQPSGLFTGFKTSYIHFPTIDCSGPGYSPAGLYPSVDGGPLIIVGFDLIAYKVTGAYQTPTVPMQSVIQQQGNCIGTSGTRFAYEVTAIGDLSADFTPPFHIENMTTHYASLPFSLWWLLGGVLLGLGIKNAAKNS